MEKSKDSLENGKVVNAFYRKSGNTRGRLMHNINLEALCTSTML